MINTTLLKQISDRFGTPLFVFDEDELTGRSRKIKEILGDIALCYSIKANPFLITPLKDVVDFFEVCSPGELQICKALEVPPEKIIYSGVQKGPEDVEDAVSYGCTILTAESLLHYDLICKAAAKHDSVKDIILRLSAGTQFGMSLEDIKNILERPDEHINIKGLHYFAGTGRKKLKKQREELEMLAGVISDMELPMLEYGPGLPYPYFSDEDFSDTLQPLKELMPDLEQISGICRLSVEMGRFIASSCGHYITKICDIKKSSDNNWCIVDGGINHVNYLGQIMGMKVPVIAHLRKDGTAADDDGALEKYSLCGSLCTTNDVLVRSFPMSSPREGDLLVFSNIGAYSVTEAMGLFLSRTLPAVIMVKDDKPAIARDFTQSWKINIGK